MFYTNRRSPASSVDEFGLCRSKTWGMSPLIGGFVGLALSAAWLAFAFYVDTVLGET
jgi:hypothetical protein